jgi:hypothetical protein
MMAECGSMAPSRDGNGNQIRFNNRSSTYEIKIEGHLDAKWSQWLGGMEITHDEGGYTLLRGVIPDQSALHGILAQIRDLGLTLVSLRPTGMDVYKED